jgi:hypothetical protein
MKSSGQNLASLFERKEKEIKFFFLRIRAVVRAGKSRRREKSVFEKKVVLLPLSDVSAT